MPQDIIGYQFIFFPLDIDFWDIKSAFREGNNYKYGFISNIYVVSQLSTDSKLLLTAGFGVLGLGIILSYLNPATGYESSIYSGTPVSFWISVCTAFLISVYLLFFTEETLARHLGIVLGGKAMTGIVALPIIRGYYYIGEGDALKHLGRARDIDSGVLPMHELRYPTVHSLGVIVGHISGIKIRYSLLLFIVVFVLCFFIFVPLSIKELTSSPIATRIGFVSGLLLLPLNFVGIHMQIHPTSQAVMFAPLLLFILISIYQRRTRQFTILFMIVVPTFVMLHPQQAANFVLFFWTIVMVQLALIFSREDLGLRYTKHLFFPVVYLTILFWQWSQNIPAFEGNLGALVTNLLLRETGAATQIDSRGLALEQLGSSLEEIFLRMFLIALLYCVVTGLLICAVLAKTVGLAYLERLQNLLVPSDRNKQHLILYFSFGFITTLGLFFAYVIADIRTQYFRHFGFMMMVVSVLGGVAITHIYSNMNMVIDENQAKKVGMAVLLTFILVSVPVVYPSPYIFQSSGHVTEAQMNGFEQAFNYRQEEITYDKVRSSPHRYGQAISATKNSKHHYYIDYETVGVPDKFANQELREYLDRPVYLSITESDRVRETIIFNGFKFNQEDFKYIENEPGINKVQTNGGLDIYLVRPAKSK